MSQQIWLYAGYGILAIIGLAIVVIAWGLYTSYNNTKNADVSLPTLDVIQREEDDFFLGEEALNKTATIETDASKLLSRKELRNQKKNSETATPVVAATESNSFFDEEDFSLSDGKD